MGAEPSVAGYPGLAIDGLSFSAFENTGTALTRHCIRFHPFEKIIGLASEGLDRQQARFIIQPIGLSFFFACCTDASWHRDDTQQVLCDRDGYIHAHGIILPRNRAYCKAIAWTRFS
ncbi:MAG: hypothetical protein ACRCTD_05100 [Beijerinckiaceae bacterium]